MIFSTIWPGQVNQSMLLFGNFLPVVEKNRSHRNQHMYPNTEPLTFDLFSSRTILFNKKTISGIVLLNETARIPNVLYQ